MEKVRATLKLRPSREQTNKRARKITHKKNTTTLPFIATIIVTPIRNTITTAIQSFYFCDHWYSNEKHTDAHNSVLHCYDHCYSIEKRADVGKKHKAATEL